LGTVAAIFPGIHDIAMKPQGETSLLRRVLHIFRELSLIAWWTAQLLSLFRLGLKWISKFTGIFLYQLFLLPGFLQLMYFYFTSPSVVRSIPYGRNPRNRLDLFVPSIPPPSGGYPVLIFVTGGVWIIGYKGWGTFLGKCLSSHGVLVASLDYRNFPQGTVSDMVDDVSTGIEWCLTNLSQWKGDTTNVYLMGQSAGAHLSALALMRQVEQTATGRRGSSSSRWSSLSSIKSFIGLSGGYMLDKILAEHFHKRGLYRQVFFAIMEAGITGRNLHIALPRSSPEAVLHTAAFHEHDMKQHVPKILLLHGDADRSMPVTASISFHEGLVQAGVDSTLKLYPGKSHTDAFIEDPMKGGVDQLLKDLFSVIYEKEGKEMGEQDWEKRLEELSYIRPLLPAVLVDLARFVMPF